MTARSIDPPPPVDATLHRPECRVPILSVGDDHGVAVDIVVVPRTVRVLEGAALEVDPRPDSFSPLGAHASLGERPAVAQASGQSRWRWRMDRPPRSMPPHITTSITTMTTSIATEPLIML